MAGVIVHEWIEKSGGAEKVLDSFSQLFPTAPIHCLWSDAADRYADGRVEESWLSRTPFRRAKAMALPLMPAAWRNLRTSGEPDWILVSSHLFAHHAKFRSVSPEVPKLVYAHTPARYIWTPELDVRGNSIVARVASPMLRTLDKKRIREATSIAANSKFVADRIRNTWEREAHVIYPPVDVAKIQSRVDWRTELSPLEMDLLEKLPSHFILGASRFVPYKRLDQVISVGEMMGVPVVLAGGGPEEGRLKDIAARASVPVFFVGRVSDEMLYSLFQLTQLFVFPPVEDFGIVPVEAMAAGAPVLANRSGGAAESVRDAVTGGLASFDDLLDVRQAAEKAVACKKVRIQQHAMSFSEHEFQDAISSWVEGYTKAKQQLGSGSRVTSTK